MIPAWLSFFDAILAIVMVVVGILGAHFRYLSPFLGFQLFALGFLLSILGFIVGVIGMFVTRSGPRAVARPRAVFGTIIGLVIALPVILIVVASAKYPPINDITTDFDNPPEFEHAAEMPANRGRDMKYDKQKFAGRQSAGYKDLAPLKLPTSPDATFTKIETAAKEIPTWHVTAEYPNTHSLEGVATSRLFHFHDDFVIQVRPDGAGSVVEMRSKSRDGIGDFGANYKRIKMFFGKLSGGYAGSD